MMRILYQMDVRGDVGKVDRPVYLDERNISGQEEYCEKLVFSFSENREKIDGLISTFSPSWKIDRIPKTDLAVLRLAITEILCMDDIPSAVSINEAVELSKKYGTDQSSSFVNAILGNVVKEEIHER